MTFKELLDENLRVAIEENGCTEMLGWTHEEIAQDLIDWSSDFEDSTVEQLVPLIKAWKENNER